MRELFNKEDSSNCFEDMDVIGDLKERAGMCRDTD